MKLLGVIILLLAATLVTASQFGYEDESLPRIVSQPLTAVSGSANTSANFSQFAEVWVTNEGDMDNVVDLYTTLDGAYLRNDGDTANGYYNISGLIYVDNNTGAVGIGSPTAIYKLHVTGDVYATGDVLSSDDLYLSDQILAYSGQYIDFQGNDVIFNFLSLQPVSDGYTDLGVNSKRFDDLFIKKINATGNIRTAGNVSAGDYLFADKSEIINNLNLIGGNITVGGGKINLQISGTGGNHIIVPDDSYLRFGAGTEYKPQVLVVGDSYTGSPGRVVFRYGVGGMRWEYTNATAHPQVLLLDTEGYFQKDDADYRFLGIDDNTKLIVQEPTGDIGDTAMVGFMASSATTASPKGGLIWEDNGGSYGRGNLHLAVNGDANSNEVSISDSIIGLYGDGSVNMSRLPSEPSTATSMYVYWDVDGHLFLNESGGGGSSVWAYNQTIGTYNATYSIWAYNQTIGTYNATYSIWAYNQSGGTGNETWDYNQTTGTYNETYAIYAYNQSENITTGETTFSFLGGQLLIKVT